MKKKITRIWSVGLVVVLAASLLLSAAPVSAATDLAWNEFKLPSNATTTNVMLAADALTDFAVDFAVASDGTLYAVDGANAWVYKSTDDGKTWSRKAPTNMPAAPDLVAVAPDDPDLVVVVDGSTVFASIDGLSKLSNLNQTIVTTIVAVAVSPVSSDKHHVVVAGSAAAEAIASYDLGATVPSWTDLEGKAGEYATNNILAVAFSPGFASDFTLAAVTQTSATAVYLELYSYASGNEKWNDSAGTWSDYDGTSNIIAATVGAAVAADISLSPDYYGGDEAMRISFVGLDLITADNALDGVYRMTDESKKGIKLATDISSVAYDGTNLVAGESVATTGGTVYRSSDPLASSPSFSTTSTYQKPSGYIAAIKVRWSGSDVYAISAGDEGSFSVSHDDGKSFNDISLINTTIVDLQDIAVSDDGSVVWAVTNDALDVSVWRNASDWERVLMYTSANDFIVRLTPGDEDNIYLGQSNGTVMFYSSDGGEAKWHLRNCGVTMTDLAVEDADIVYAINTGGSVSKSTNNGFTWGSAKSTGIGTGTTITSMGEDKLLVTGTAAKVGWSTDGNANWSKTDKVVTGAGMVQAVASGLDDGDFIYASTAPGAGTAATLERWEIGSSTSWSDRSAPTTADLDGDATNETYGAYGIGLVNGTLYVLAEDNTAASSESALFRTLDGTGSTTSWSTVSALAKTHDGLPVSGVGGNALKLSTGSVKAWAVDSTANLIYYYIDTVTESGPSLMGPGDGAEIMVNPVSGGTYTISFTWERLSKATKYNLVVALDSAFEEVVVNYAGTTGTTQVISDAGSIVAQVVGGTTFMPETTYYWRVRLASDGPVYSPWSTVRSFAIGALPEAAAPVIIQQPPAPVIEVPPVPEIILQAPDIILPAPVAAPQIVIPAAPAPAPAIPSWALYIIIIIGAVLVIALIVLIMRTRRPV